MYKIYTIRSKYNNTQFAPVLTNQRLSMLSQIVLHNWYMFKVYSDNPALIKQYILFINKHFEHVFDALDVKIVDYDIPDEVMFDSGYMSDYVNKKYGLHDDDILTFEMHLILESSDNVALGEKIDIMVNDFGYEDPSYRNTPFDLLEKYATTEQDVGVIELIDWLLKFKKYIKNPKTAISYFHAIRILSMICVNDDEFGSPLSECESGCLYDSQYIDSVYLRLFQLKFFVYNEMNSSPTRKPAWMRDCFISRSSSLGWGY